MGAILEHEVDIAQTGYLVHSNRSLCQAPLPWGAHLSTRASGGEALGLPWVSLRLAVHYLQGLAIEFSQMWFWRAKPTQGRELEGGGDQPMVSKNHAHQVVSPQGLSEPTLVLPPPSQPVAYSAHMTWPWLQRGWQCEVDGHLLGSWPPSKKARTGEEGCRCWGHSEAWRLLR